MKTYGSVVRYFGHLLHEQYTLCVLTQYTLHILTQYTLHSYYTNSILCYHVALQTKYHVHSEGPLYGTNRIYVFNAQLIFHQSEGCIQPPNRKYRQFNC